MTATADALMAIFGFKRVEDKQMKSDSELLELAAKAAGISIDYWADDCPRIKTVPWDPLTNDGDALRLAVSLKLDVQFFDGYAEIHAGGDGITSAAVEPYAQDMQAATRSAIVRAAAAIGDGME